MSSAGGRELPEGMFWTGVAILVGATTTAVVISVESGPNATLPTSTGVVYQLLTERPRMW